MMAIRIPPTRVPRPAMPIWIMTDQVASPRVSARRALAAIVRSPGRRAGLGVEFPECGVLLSDAVVTRRARQPGNSGPRRIEESVQTACRTDRVLGVRIAARLRTDHAGLEAAPADGGIGR